MTGLALWRRDARRIGLSLAVAVGASLWLVPLQTRALSEDDVFQQAINYIFTGRIESEGWSRDRRPEDLRRCGPGA